MYKNFGIKIFVLSLIGFIGGQVGYHFGNKKADLPKGTPKTETSSQTDEIGERDIASEEGELKKAVKKVPVYVGNLEFKNLKTIFKTGGNLVPWKQIRLRPKEKVTIGEVRVNVGDFVNVGDTLVTFTSSLQGLKRELSQIELSLKQREFAITRKLASKNFVSANELNRKKLELKAQSLRYKIQELSSNEKNIKGPIQGIISKLSLKAGDYVEDPNKYYLDIIDPTQFKISLYLPQNFSGLLTPESEIEVFWEEGMEGEKSVFAKVLSISPIVDKKSGTLPVNLIVEEPPFSWKAGMYVEVRITTAFKENAMVVNNEALVFEEDKSALFIIEGEKAKKVFPQFGISDGKFTEIIEGVSGEDLVVIRGQGNLGKDSVVEVVEN